MIKKDLRATALQPEGQPAKKGFAGRSGLIELMDAPQSEKAAREIISSRVVLETVMVITKAREVTCGYEAQLMEQAGSICRKRASNGASEETLAASKPANDEEALKSAIERIGLKASVREKRITPSGQFNIFVLTINDETCKIMLPVKVMENADPVAFAMDYVRKQGIATRDEERQKKLERRRASRPPSQPVASLGIEQADLDRRNATYDGIEQKSGLHFFTYLGEGTESTVGVTPDRTGRSLLAELDRKIFGLHIQFNTPFPAGVLEEISTSTKSTQWIESIAQGNLKAVAKALDILVFGSEIEMHLVPAEYKDAVAKLRASPQASDYSTLKSNGILSAEEAAAFRLAMAEADHPAHILLRSMHREIVGNDGTLSEKDVELLTSQLELHEPKSSPLSEKGLHNIAEAYELLFPGSGFATADFDVLRKNHFRMMFHIRKAVIEAVTAEPSRQME